MGHIEDVPPEEMKNGCENHYLPNHAVLKDSSTATKLRVSLNNTDDWPNLATTLRFFTSHPLLQIWDDS